MAAFFKGIGIFFGMIMLVILLGCVILGINTLRLNNWSFDFKKPAEEVVLTDDFDDIFIETTTADVTILRSENEECKVVYKFGNFGITADVKVEDGVLKIKSLDGRKWYEHLTFGSFGSYIQVYLPESVYKALNVDISTGDVEIREGFTFDTITVTGSTGDFSCYSTGKNLVRYDGSTGDVDVAGITTESLYLKVSTGEVDVKNISAKTVYIKTTTGDIDVENLNGSALEVVVGTGEVEIENARIDSFTSKGTTGEISLDNVIVAGKITIERGTGDVELFGCDGGEIEIETTTGEVECSLLSGKMFTANTGSGKVRVPESTEGGRCKITTSTGSIKVTIK